MRKHRMTRVTWLLCSSQDFISSTPRLWNAGLCLLFGAGRSYPHTYVFLWAHFPCPYHPTLYGTRRTSDPFLSSPPLVPRPSPVPTCHVTHSCICLRSSYTRALLCQRFGAIGWSLMWLPGGCAHLVRSAPSPPAAEIPRMMVHFAALESSA